MAKNEEESSITRAEPALVTVQEYELFQQEGIEVIAKYNGQNDDGSDREIYVIHLYPMFLGFKEAMQELVVKNGQLFQMMMNSLNMALHAARAEINHLKSKVIELESKRIIH